MTNMPPASALDAIRDFGEDFGQISPGNESAIEDVLESSNPIGFFLSSGYVDELVNHSDLDSLRPTTNLSMLAQAAARIPKYTEDVFINNCSQAEYRYVESIQLATRRRGRAFRPLVVYTNEDGAPVAVRKSTGEKTAFSTHHTGTPDMVIGAIGNRTPQTRSYERMRYDASDFTKTALPNVSVYQLPKTSEFVRFRVSRLAIGTAEPDLQLDTAYYTFLKSGHLPGFQHTVSSFPLPRTPVSRVPQLVDDMLERAKII